jgi:hypothetical protein
MDILDGDVVGPSYSVVSNGNDMYMYLYNLLHVFNPNSASFSGMPKIEIDLIELLTPQTVFGYDDPNGFGEGQSYVFGWSKTIFNNVEIYSHAGAAYGYSSFIVLIPSLEFGIFSLDNKYKGSENVVYTVREIMINLFFKPTSSNLHERMLMESRNLLLGTERIDSSALSGGKDTVTRSQGRHLINFPVSLDAYEGTYRHPAYGIIVIKINTQKDGLLYSRPMSDDSSFYELEYVRDHIFKPILPPNSSFPTGKWFYFVDDPSGNIIFLFSQLANAKSTKGVIAPIAFMKNSPSSPLAGKWLDQEFRKLPFQYPRDDYL